MINRKATIRWKGYDPDTLSHGSHKRVWANCENCGDGRWVEYKAYNDLCLSCAAYFRVDHVVRNCKWCAREIETTEKRDRLFCSNKCYSKWFAETHKGSNNTFYGQTHTDENKRLIGENTRSQHLWDDPVYREKMLNRRILKRDTSIEVKMQNILRQYGYFFQTHVPLCNICIPDIILPERQIIVQCDGDYWHNYPDGLEKDRNQDKILTKNGWRVIRFWEHEINENIQDCLRKFEAIYHDIEYKPFYTQGTLDGWLD